MHRSLRATALKEGGRGGRGGREGGREGGVGKDMNRHWVPSRRVHNLWLDANNANHADTSEDKRRH